jgi:tetratricopeptide (TPR) repeat protein
VELENGNVARAKVLYESIRQRDSSGATASATAAVPAASEGLARIAFDAENYNTAVVHLKSALAQQPTASALHHRLAAAYRALGDDEAAEHHGSQAGSKPVSYPDPLVASLDRGAVGVGRRLARGGVALAEGRLGAAVAEYRSAVEQDPSDFSARLNLGLVLADHGDGEAELHLREATVLDPQSAVARHALGRLLAGRSAVAEARELYRRAAELDPMYEAAYYHLGELEAGEGRHQEALSAFTSALDINQQAHPPRVMRALSLLALERPREAVEDLRIALEGSTGDEALIRLRLGEALQRAGDADAALVEYEKAARGGLEPQVRATAELSAGNLLLSRGERDAARVYLEAAVKSNPLLGPAHLNLAGLLALGGESDLAVVHYRRAAELDPDDLPPRFFLAQALLEIGHTAEAAKTFEEVLAIDPLHEGSLVGRAAIQVTEKRYSEARSGLAQALSTQPKSVAIAHALARLLATCPDPAVRDGARAVELSLQVMSVDGGLLHAETVAMSMAAAGRFEEAINWQREVIRQAQEAPQERLASLRANLARYESGQTCCPE